MYFCICGFKNRPLIAAWCVLRWFGLFCCLGDVWPSLKKAEGLESGLDFNFNFDYFLKSGPNLRVRLFFGEWGELESI